MKKYIVKHILKREEQNIGMVNMTEQEKELIFKLTKIIELARKIGPAGFMDACIRMVEEETKCGGCGKILGPMDVCSPCLEKSWKGGDNR